MVERLLLYCNDERTAVTEIRERFQRRKDKLRERRTYPLQDTTVVRPWPLPWPWPWPGLKRRGEGGGGRGSRPGMVALGEVAAGYHSLAQR